MIYLDNAATTQLDPSVVAAMMPYLTDAYGNPGAIYSLGRTARGAVEKARSQVAEWLGAKPEQIIFTSGGTEANNMALRSLSIEMQRRKRPHIVTAQNEHESIIRTARRIHTKGKIDDTGHSVTFLPVDKRGSVQLGVLKAAIQDDTGLVSLMYMNNETGAENPISDIATLCRERGVFFHTDCVQAASCCKLDISCIGCDMLSVSSHKIHGPKGVGALFIKEPRLCEPLILGGHAQEFGLRGGTESVAGIVGFGEACAVMQQKLRDADLRTSLLKQSFYTVLTEELKKDGLDEIAHVNGPPVVGHGKILNLRFDGVDGETLLLMLDANGVCVSAGSACNSHDSYPSHVLLAMGLTEEQARSSIRVSFSRMNWDDEVVEAAKIMAECVRALHRECLHE